MVKLTMELFAVDLASLGFPIGASKFTHHEEIHLRSSLYESHNDTFEGKQWILWFHFFACGSFVTNSQVMIHVHLSRTRARIFKYRPSIYSR